MTLTRVIYEGETDEQRQRTKRRHLAPDDLYDVTLLVDDGLRHKSRLGTLTLCGRRTLVQGHWPARTLCEECAKLEQKLNPSKGPKPKQPAASVAVRQGVDAALPRAPSGGILEPRSDCERSSADRSRPVFRNDP
jgi:hypothetical protein